jgi:hypothetical protein
MASQPRVRYQDSAVKSTVALALLLACCPFGCERSPSQAAVQPPEPMRNIRLGTLRGTEFIPLAWNVPDGSADGVQGGLDGAVLLIAGKIFRVERGIARFASEDPANPEVDAAASWSAPDGTRVIATFIGDLKTGKVTLRAEPALSQQEILARLLLAEPLDAGEAAGKTRHK